MRHVGPKSYGACHCESRRIGFPVLTKKEIDALPAGKIINIFVHEYVFNECPFYNNEKDIPNYSEDNTSLQDLIANITLNTLMTHTEPAQTIFPAMENRYWASFFTIPYGDKNYPWEDCWASGQTMALAICRAALLYKMI